MHDDLANAFITLANKVKVENKDANNTKKNIFGFENTNKQNHEVVEALRTMANRLQVEN